MEDLKTCIRCLYDSNHPLGLEINEEGVCSGCLIHEEKNNLDWDSRWQDLEELVKPYRSIQKVKYDCIVPVSGAGDSYFILHTVKEKLKLNPLVVSYNKYFNTPVGIRNLANLRSKFNVDILIQNINPKLVKKVTKTTISKIGSIYWPCIAGQTVFPVQTSIRFKIPLIIWGAHQGIEQVGMASHLHNIEMTRRYRKDHDLMGYEADDLMSVFDTLSEEDICQYRYPPDSDLRRNSTIGIYLGNYVRWDPKKQHEDMIKIYDYKTSNFSRTFDCYDYVDCYNYMNLHDLIKFYKTGYSSVTDHACREIRHGRISREAAKDLVNFYQWQPTEYLDLFLDWLDIKETPLNFSLNRYHNKKIWIEDEPNIWLKRIDNRVIKNRPSLSKKFSFIKNDYINSHQKSEYIIIGKGFP